MLDTHLAWYLGESTKYHAFNPGHDWSLCGHVHRDRNHGDGKRNPPDTACRTCLRAGGFVDKSFRLIRTAAQERADVVAWLSSQAGRVPLATRQMVRRLCEGLKVGRHEGASKPADDDCPAEDCDGKLSDHDHISHEGWSALDVKEPDLPPFPKLPEPTDGVP